MMDDYEITPDMEDPFSYLRFQRRDFVSSKGELETDCVLFQNHEITIAVILEQELSGLIEDVTEHWMQSLQPKKVVFIVKSLDVELDQLKDIAYFLHTNDVESLTFSLCEDCLCPILFKYPEHLKKLCCKLHDENCPQLEDVSECFQ